MDGKRSYSLRARLTRVLAPVLALLLVCPHFVLAGDDINDLNTKKYVRQPREPLITRPRRVKPFKSETARPDTTKVQPPARRDDDRSESAEVLPTGPAIKRSDDVAKGPEIRIGLASDISFANIASSQPVAYFHNERNEFVALGSQQVKVQLANTSVRERPGRVFRVQVASFKTSREADQLVSQLRKRFNEPVEARYDREMARYDVTVGEFSSQRDAQTFMVQVMNAGYRKTWVAKEERGSARPERLIRAVSGGGEQLLAARDRVVFTSQDDDNAPLNFNGKPYRGRLEIFVNKRDRLTVINVLPMEDYVRGVVPNELSPTGFPMVEALKAQAVAARTYAMRNRGQFEAEGYDLLPTPLSQVYGGMATEHPLSDRAVRETAGMVATYESQPINALYTSTCGGRTESSEFVFTEALPYLVSVSCSPDRFDDQGRKRRVESDRDGDRDDSERGSGSRRLLKTARKPEPIMSEGGRAITREVAILSILRFALPETPAVNYFAAAASEKELTRWVARAAELLGHQPPAPVKDPVSLPGFASLLSAAIYGNDRPSSLLSPADADYLLGADARDIPSRARAEVAALLQEGILIPAADGSLRPRAAVTRAMAVGAIVRALAKFNQPPLETGTARPVEGGRIKIRAAKGKDAVEYELASDYYLFRVINNDAFPAASVEVIGGEKVNYHLDARGRIDYLEVLPNTNGAASDRFSVYSRWQARYTTAELKARLAEARVNVGELVDLQGVKYGYSRRLAELKVIGTQGEKSITGLRIRSALGLRESLFIIMREYDQQGRVAAFRFVGRGWGHGVGMCQVGAYGLALEGLDYQQILKTYYSNIDLTKLY